MGFYSDIRPGSLIAQLSRRIQTLSKIFANPANRLRKIKRPLQILSFLIAAAILGIWAEGIARTEATQAWERSHPPSAPIWRHALGSRGFRELQEKQDVLLFQKVSRSLPSSLDDAAVTWISPNSHWIAIALPGGSEMPEPFRVFCLECKKDPAEWKNWEALGSGWSAFETLLSRLDELPKTAPHTSEKSKFQIPFDRREIRY